jgi:hypothetical protein
MLPTTRSAARRGMHELRAAERCARRGDRSGHLAHVEEAAEMFERAATSCGHHLHRTQRTTSDTADIVLPPEETNLRSVVRSAFEDTPASRTSG